MNDGTTLHLAATGTFGGKIHTVNDKKRQVALQNVMLICTDVIFYLTFKMSCDMIVMLDGAAAIAESSS